MIQIGTSGFSYDDWHGHFYPSDLPKSGRLEHYARQFDCVEINSSFYRQPSASMCERLASRVPDGFRFATKVYGGITHDHENVTAADFQVFLAGVQPWVETGRLGAVLAQFPNRFRPTKATVRHVRRLRAEWPELPLVVEFRHEEWMDERAFELLAAEKLGFCCVDEPRLPGLLPPALKTTASPAYLRFHGRNADKWYHHEQAWERYDYLYSESELEEWVPRVKSLAAEADDLYVFFNNHYQAQAVMNATQLRQMLGLENEGPVRGGGAEEVDHGNGES